ncbi:hypothetical protein [Lichenicoccus sp.]|uniref:hypothetical protein n=1 Tax=Lichenicoccus sp. TaxID=2781899 RepID=UPI003D0E2915
MIDLTVAVPAFLTSAVEWVEAFTIVLAVGLQIGGRRAGSAALAALGVLLVLGLLTGGVLHLGRALGWLQFVIGVFLLLFGTRWLGKAIARRAGRKPLHDEDAEFAQTRAALSRGDRRAAWFIAFKGTLLEGLEVWLIVVALGMPHGGAAARWTSSAGGALLALVVVAAAGLLIRAPLSRVPENAIKFLVGAMITAFGTFWTVESLAGAGAWPLGEWSLPALALFYLVGGLALSARPFRAQTA